MKRLTAHGTFYPAAALYGAVALPASVLVMTGTSRTPVALANPAAHAHEMLLGFALAVVAGNQLGTVTPRRLGTLLALWAAARASFVVAPGHVVATMLNAGFAVLLAWHVVPRLFRSAKKARNQALPAVLTGLCVAAVAWALAASDAGPGVARVLPHATVVLFAGLLLFMGGRVIAPAVAGQLYRQGGDLAARVQPRLEAALIVGTAVALAGVLLPGARDLASAALVATGAAAAVRMARWRLWRVRGRPDLLCLAAGYAWLAAGLVAFGAALFAGRLESAALHLVTVGALGTLTFNVMALSWLLKARRPGEATGPIVWGTTLIAITTVLRIAGAFYPLPWLLLAASCWTIAYCLLLVVFWRHRPRARPPRAAHGHAPGNAE